MSISSFSSATSSVDSFSSLTDHFSSLQVSSTPSSYTNPIANLTTTSSQSISSDKTDFTLLKKEGISPLPKDTPLELIRFLRHPETCLRVKDSSGVLERISYACWTTHYGHQIVSQEEVSSTQTTEKETIEYAKSNSRCFLSSPEEILKQRQKKSELKKQLTKCAYSYQMLFRTCCAESINCVEMNSNKENAHENAIKKFLEYSSAKVKSNSDSDSNRQQEPFFTIVQDTISERFFEITLKNNELSFTSLTHKDDEKLLKSPQFLQNTDGFIQKELLADAYQKMKEKAIPTTISAQTIAKIIGTSDSYVIRISTTTKKHVITYYDAAMKKHLNKQITDANVFEIVHGASSKLREKIISFSQNKEKGEQKESS